MSDGMSDAAYAAESYAKAFVKKNFPGLKEFNPYHVPYRGKGYNLYETWLDHIVEIVENHKVVKAWEFKPSGKRTGLKVPLGNPPPYRRPKSMAVGSGIRTRGGWRRGLSK